MPDVPGKFSKTSLTGDFTFKIAQKDWDPTTQFPLGLNQKQSIKIRSTWSSLINSFYLNPPSLSLNEYSWCNTNFICSCIVGSIMRLFYFIKSRPRLLSRGYNLCTFPPIVANISCGALVSLDTTTVIDISLRKKLTYKIFFYLWFSRNPAKRFCSYFCS